MIFINNRSKYKFIKQINNNKKDNIEYIELFNKLKTTKDKITNYKYDWESNKKCINNFEYIYISSNNNINICSIIPVSRSFYKLTQMIIDYKLIDKNNNNIACIAEGPGGFIQSVLNYNNNNNINIDNIYGITLIDKNDKNIPNWNQHIKNNKSVTILSGVDNTGNLYNLDNINDFISKMKKIDLVTCDGGIDYSDNYNNQEINSYKLLYSEIYLMLNIQNECGNSVIKFFDLFYYKSIQLIFILTLVYDYVWIYKPTFSRVTNSEKYIICKNYKKNEDIIKTMEHYWNNIDEFCINIPNTFINKINKYNDIIVNEQCDNINKILNIKGNNNIYLSKNNIKLCIEWCKKYNLPVNNKYH